uniref:Uncharacterized protein n=1 Tax=Glossina brevipalpis TaxID=37001 RepID=A0A1A9X2V4_9MUSC
MVRARIKKLCINFIQETFLLVTQITGPFLWVKIISLLNIRNKLVRNKNLFKRFIFTAPIKRGQRRSKKEGTRASAKSQAAQTDITLFMETRTFEHTCCFHRNIQNYVRIGMHRLQLKRGCLSSLSDLAIEALFLKS